MSEGASDGEAIRRGAPSSSDTGDAGQEELAGRLSDLARMLEQQDDVEQTLNAIVHGAVGTVPGAEQASISVVQRRREVHTRASTSELPRAVDRAQYETGQGPCLDTLFEQATVRLPDMAVESRWPEFTKRATDIGVGSMLSVQLFVEGDDLGALNLVSKDTDAFSEESEQIALLFASHAAVAMSGALHQEQLQRAVHTRQLIGQAQGILMERHKITDDRAFALLARASQDTNRKLVDLAAELVRTGNIGSDQSL